VYALLNPITHAQYQSSLLTVAEWNTQIIPVQAAVDALSRGEWTNETWQPLFECLNRIESMTKLNRVDAAEWINTAQDVMVTALDRRTNTGATAFKADELAKIREIVRTYGDLLKEVSHAQFYRACQHTNANISRILNNMNRLHQVGDCVFDRKVA